MNSRAFLPVLLLAGLVASARGDRLSRIVSLADLTQATNSSVFDIYKTTVRTGTTPWNSPLADLYFQESKASFGQDYSPPRDWRAYNMVHLCIRNLESRAVNLRFVVQTRSDLNDYTNSFTGQIRLNPGETRRFVCYLNVDDPWPLRLEYIYPAITAAYQTVIQAAPYRDLSTVYHWRLSYQDTLPARVHLSEIYLMRQSLDPTGLVDQYGQYTDRTWPNKIVSDADFQTFKSRELTDLDANPGTGEQQGSLTVVNASPVPGKWAVVQGANGRKYLQHPNGRLFWIFGINGVLDSLHTPVQYREHYFTSLPSTTGRFASCYGTSNTPDGLRRSYSHRRQNLMIKYGDLYEASWTQMVKKRFASWGVNTVEGSKAFMDNSVPYVLLLKTTDFGTKLAVPYSQWGPLPDPYTSGFQTFITDKFATALAPYKSHTNLLGVFVDNELSWGTNETWAKRYNVAVGALTAPATQPAKSVLVSQLQAKYSTIQALNLAWQSSFVSWDALRNNRTWKPTNYTTGMQSDFHTYVKNFALKYFSQVKAALATAGLKSLYLGCRFEAYTHEVVSASCSYADVISFNVYRLADKVEWSFFDTLPKPVMFSEAGYGLHDGGTFGGPNQFCSHSERVAAMKSLLDRSLKHRNIVGIMWYCYADQPITGRWSDYQNAGLGIVDVADNPYGPIVSLFRSFTKTMYAVRNGP